MRNLWRISLFWPMRFFKSLDRRSTRDRMWFLATVWEHGLLTKFYGESMPKISVCHSSSMHRGTDHPSSMARSLTQIPHASAVCRFPISGRPLKGGKILMPIVCSCDDARRYGLNENLQNKNIRRFVYPSFKADYKMIESYVLNGDASRLPICKAAGCPIEDAVCSGTVRIHCPIHALSGERDQRVTRIGLDGWKHVTSSTFSLHRCAGCDHDCIHRNNAALLKFLKADLTQVHRDHIIEA